MNEKELINLSNYIHINESFIVDHLGILASRINQLDISGRIDK